MAVACVVKEYQILAHRAQMEAGHHALMVGDHRVQMAEAAHRDSTWG
jgi:hypothetical protein